MGEPGRARHWLPWLLCAAAIGLYALAVVLHLVILDRAPVRGEDSPYFLFGLHSFVAGALVGALIAARLVENLYGWVLCAAALVVGVVGVAAELRNVASLPYWAVVTVEDNAFRALLGLVMLLFLLFPDGRLPGRRWRWLPPATAVLVFVVGSVAVFARSRTDPAASTPWALTGAAGRQLAIVVEVGFVLLFCCVLAAMASVLLRFRRADVVERQQLKWFVFAAAILAAAVVPDAVDLRMGNGVWPYLVASMSVVVPIAVGIAVLRYRLYEIDRIISRTLTWALLTAGVFALYGIVVTQLHRLSPVTGGSELAVAGVTLAAAAAFGPARRRLQATVDRRFDRARYDAVRIADAYAARLRGQIDLDEITAGLLRTVEVTMVPTRLALRLQEPHLRRDG